jgi:hypothetical protein
MKRGLLIIISRFLVACVILRKVGRIRGTCPDRSISRPQAEWQRLSSDSERCRRTQHYALLSVTQFSSLQPSPTGSFIWYCLSDAIRSSSPNQYCISTFGPVEKLPEDLWEEHLHRGDPVALRLEPSSLVIP